jgi:pimeloyl-ACP methyl ester carboxylesterase
VAASYRPLTIVHASSTVRQVTIQPTKHVYLAQRQTVLAGSGDTGHAANRTAHGAPVRARIGWPQPIGPRRVTVAILPGAEPFTHDGSGEIGVLLCHGFTGSPQSMAPWGAALADAGFTVMCPLLPGHGRTWQEMNRTTWPDWYREVDQAFGGLVERCRTVFVFGLSMGGTLALRLAERHGSSVAGLVLVNPSVTTERKDAALLTVL